jgi:hypothetical protein
MVNIDEYSVCFSGKNLNIESLKNALSELEVSRVSEAGSLTYWSKTTSENKKSPRGIPFEESSISFDSNGRTLIEFLEYLNSKISQQAKYRISDTQVWSLMYRSSQINGELSSYEITELAKLGAVFLWSIITDDDVGI